MRIKEFNKEFAENSKIVIYGTTVGGKIIFQCLLDMGMQVTFFCDRSGKYSEFCGCPVKDPSVLCENRDYIVLNVLTRSFNSACQYMEQLGYKEIYSCWNLIKDREIADFAYTENEKELVIDFLEKYPLYVSNNEKDIYLPSLEVFITERCTLRCRDCSHLIPRYQEPKDYNIEDIIKSLRNVLKVSKRISELIILGGEPLLHRELHRLLEWGYEQDGIGVMTIISNGSVRPSESLLLTMRETGTRIRLSNYGKYSTKLNEIKNICLEIGIPCFINDELWTDMGKMYDHNYTEEELREIFTDCPFAFSLLLLKGRMYRCAHVAHLNNLQIIDSSQHDSVDVSEITIETMEEKRRELRAYLQIDYLEGCSFCNGIKNSVQGIEPAIQGER